MALPSGNHKPYSKKKQLSIFLGIFIVGFMILAAVGYATNPDNSNESKIIKNKVAAWKSEVRSCNLGFDNLDEFAEFVDGIDILLDITRADINLYADSTHTTYIDEIKKDMDLVTACIDERKAQFGL